MSLLPSNHLRANASDASEACLLECSSGNLVSSRRTPEICMIYLVFADFRKSVKMIRVGDSYEEKCLLLRLFRGKLDSAGSSKGGLLIPEKR